jgi:DNA (cytosine-5)-methyltransferase 1
VTKIVQPEWIIGENVKGLLSRKGRLNPEAPLRPVIEIIRDLFDSIGYRITYQVIDVSTIGVPQNRKRLIIIGHRGTTYPHVPWNSLTDATTPSLTSIRSFLEPHLDDAMELPALYKPQDQPANYWIPTTETAVKGTPHKNLDRLVRGLRNLSSAEKTENPTLTNPIIEPEGLISFGVRKGGYHGMVVNPDVPCNTIISTYNLCPRLFVGLYNPTIQKYWIRCMTSKELGQIQGFPATYQWQGTEKEKIIQIGNAVPPPLAERIGRTILSGRVELKEEAQGLEATEAVTGTTVNPAVTANPL